MTPQEITFGLAYFAILCAGGAIFILFLFAIGGLLGLTIIDIWKVQKYPKQIKLLLSAGLVFLPGIGVMSWAVYFGRNRKLIFRIFAFIIGGLYLLMQLSPLLVKESALGTGLINAAMLSFIWLPFVLVAAALVIFNSNHRSPTQRAADASPAAPRR